MEQTKLNPELMLLQTHFTRLLERGRRECAMGALHHGLQEIAQLVAAHPELALKAHALLSEQDDALAGHVGTGNGRAVALILARLIDEIRPRPEANGFNQRHHPMAAAALRLDIPKMRADIAADGAITFAAVPAAKPADAKPSEDHDNG
jgi:hypothetical protein